MRRFLRGMKIFGRKEEKFLGGMRKFFGKNEKVFGKNEVFGKTLTH